MTSKTAKPVSNAQRAVQQLREMVFSGELPAGGTISLQQTFLAGQSAIIALKTSGGGHIAVKVVDGDERTVCASSGGAVRCRWTPPYTQRHQIRIKNPRGGRVRYFISFS